MARPSVGPGVRVSPDNSALGGTGALRPDGRKGVPGRSQLPVGAVPHPGVLAAGAHPRRRDVGVPAAHEGEGGRWRPAGCNLVMPITGVLQLPVAAVCDSSGSPHIVTPGRISGVLSEGLRAIVLR